VPLTTLQSFALRESLLDKPWFKRLEKPRMGRRERIPTAEEIAALLKGASPEFRLIYITELAGGQDRLPPVAWEDPSTAAAI
jgi:hypothetical protein